MEYSDRCLPRKLYVRPRATLGMLLTEFLARLQYIIISRFIINLRRVGRPPTIHSMSANYSQFSVANFRMPSIESIIGNFAQPLEHPLEQEDISIDANGVTEMGTEADYDSDMGNLA